MTGLERKRAKATAHGDDKPMRSGTPKILLAGDPRIRSIARGVTADTGGAVVVGWREWVGLPGLGIGSIMAKIDSGARTSALHANSIESFEAGGAAYVRFDVSGEAADAPLHEAPVIDVRDVRSSNGEAESRFVIRTELSLAGRSWPVELTLTNRQRMELPMLIGREALAGRVLIDTQASWIWGRLPRRASRVRAAPARGSTKGDAR